MIWTIERWSALGRIVAKSCQVSRSAESRNDAVETVSTMEGGSPDSSLATLGDCAAVAASATPKNVLLHKPGWQRNMDGITISPIRQNVKALNWSWRAKIKARKEAHKSAPAQKLQNAELDAIKRSKS